MAIVKHTRNCPWRSPLCSMTAAEVEAERVERVINGIIRRLESSGETEVDSTTVGEMIMDALASLDQVAYVRFASVYRNFREAKDFEEFITDELGADGPQ